MSAPKPVTREDLERAGVQLPKQKDTATRRVYGAVLSDAALARIRAKVRADADAKRHAKS